MIILPIYCIVWVLNIIMYKTLGFEITIIILLSTISTQLFFKGEIE